MKYKRFTILLFSAMIVLSLCGCVSPANTDTDKFRIVTTNFPPYDFVRNLAGERADITMLLAPSEESHTFEPTPQDVILLTQADLFIAGGGESDAWVKKMIESAEIDADKTIFMIDCVEHVQVDTHNHAEHNSYSAYDEHVWTSPAYAKEICTVITDKLIAIDPENEAFYAENLSRYKSELTELDHEFSAIVQNGARNTIVFADRFPFYHFSERYSLTYYAAFPGCASETEPDAATMKLLIDTVKTQAIPVVFYTELSNQKVADSVCEATDAKQLLLHSCHSVTKEEFERGETYLSLMKQNAKHLKEALS